MKDKNINPKVYLLGMTNTEFSDNNSEAIISTAAKLCYSKTDINTLAKKQTPESVKKFINKLGDMGHQSPIEHLSFTFGIEGVSRTCSHQLVRHRIASFSQQSQRYVDLKDTYEYITPPEIESDEELKELYDDTNDLIFEKYKLLTEKLKNKYIKEGMTETNALKKAIEDARFILPNACETKLVVTMNARSLLNFFELRCCNRAQWEIRDVANQMLDICLEKAPDVFAKAGPSCVYDVCHEGAMSCGKKPKARERQRKIND